MTSFCKSKFLQKNQNLCRTAACFHCRPPYVLLTPLLPVAKLSSSSFSSSPLSSSSQCFHHHHCHRHLISIIIIIHCHHQLSGCTICGLGLWTLLEKGDFIQLLTNSTYQVVQWYNDIVTQLHNDTVDNMITRRHDDTMTQRPTGWHHKMAIRWQRDMMTRWHNNNRKIPRHMHNDTMKWWHNNMTLWHDVIDQATTWLLVVTGLLSVISALLGYTAIALESRCLLASVE